MQPEVELQVDPPAGPQSLLGPCPVRVRLLNRGAEPVVVNRRLATGYRNHLARELFVELLDAETGAPAPYRVVDYDREFSEAEDYITLQPGKQIEGQIDLCRWYAPRFPGRYRLVVHYQADEDLADPPPGVLRGILTAPPVEVTFRAEFQAGGQR